ncbi:hypothetical protein BHM03_00010526 [Ensete ventricosum]|uniref:Expansin-like EG45 domain-containing protein n=1 Tax=Ensete ventricosum TaxID=4639 RepID=A0A445MD09_ENSVE|nr:hypothetical protein BHM03_00010526 [Ensete ventricosum]
MIYTSLPCSGQASTTGMYKSILLPSLISFLFLSPPSLADVGTAASYGPPYLPTACYGTDESQFPPDNLFAAAGDAIWDNDASCGRQYLVRCLSSATPGACLDGTVQVTVVDYAPSLVSAPSAVGATMVLSETAFGMISQSSANEINIEFTQYILHSPFSSLYSYTARNHRSNRTAIELCWMRQASFLLTSSNHHSNFNRVYLFHMIRFCLQGLTRGKRERRNQMHVGMYLVVMVGFFSLLTASVWSSLDGGELSVCPFTSTQHALFVTV